MLKQAHPSSKSIRLAIQLKRHSLLLRLGIGNLIDNQPDSALGNDVGHTIAQLDANDCPRWIDLEHGEQVHNRVCAPADACHDLCSTNLTGNDWVFLAFGGSCKSDKEFVHDVQEEGHGQKPAHPTWSQVTSDDKFSVVTRYNHK